MTQNNLGNILGDQGIRTGGERGTQLLAEAVTAYRQALEVRTRETLPLQWAQTHNNLAKAYVALEDWPNAAAAMPMCCKCIQMQKKPIALRVVSIMRFCFNSQKPLR